MSYTPIATGYAVKTDEYKAIVEKNKDFTVKEMTTSTSGLSLAQLVATRAAIQMLVLVDARKLCRTELVPERGGMVYHFQKVVVPALATSGTLTEGSDLTPTELTLTDVTATLKVFAGYTQISDIAARQAAVNLSQIIGTAHGNALVYQVNADIYGTIQAATTNPVHLGAYGDSTEATLAWANVFTGRQKVLSQRGLPNAFVTSPKKLYELINANATNIQFYGALQDYLKMGQMPEIMGMKIFEDPTWGETFTGTTTEKYAAILWAGEAEGFAMADDVHTEVQRWAPQVGCRMVSSLSGKSALIMDPWVSLLQHA